MSQQNKQALELSRFEGKLAISKLILTNSWPWKTILLHQEGTDIPVSIIYSQL